MRTPKISVIIPAFNYGSKLVSAVNSIRSQSIKDVEIVIVNDASNDNTHDIAQTLIDEKTIYVKNEVNLGVYATLNKGFKIASGEYLCQLDCDDVLPENSLFLRVDYLEKHHVEAVHGGIIITRDGKEKYIAPINTNDRLQLKEFLKNSSKSRGINNATFMYSREVFERIGYPATTAKFFPHNDYEFALRTILNCKVGIIDEPLYYYRHHDNSHSINNGQTIASINNFKELNKLYFTLFEQS